LVSPQPLFAIRPFNSLKPRQTAIFGGFLAFLFSGLFHEHYARVMFHNASSVQWDLNEYVPWTMTTFFLLQFVACTLEKFIYSLLPVALQKAVVAIPQPIKLSLSYALILVPTTPFFLISFQRVFVHFGKIIPTILVE
jgi:hypothetical protein